MPTLHIIGMTCQHCVTAVEQALGRVDGLTDVEVNLDSATATYSKEKPVFDEDIVKAIEDAGYKVAQ